MCRRDRCRTRRRRGVREVDLVEGAVVLVPKREPASESLRRAVARAEVLEVARRQLEALPRRVLRPLVRVDEAEHLVQGVVVRIAIDEGEVWKPSGRYTNSSSTPWKSSLPALTSSGCPLGPWIETTRLLKIMWKRDDVEGDLVVQPVRLGADFLARRALGRENLGRKHVQVRSRGLEVGLAREVDVQSLSRPDWLATTRPRIEPPPDHWSACFVACDAPSSVEKTFCVSEVRS